MRYPLYTNILIYLLKNRPPSLGERIEKLAAADSLRLVMADWASCRWRRPRGT